jgi:hypothetical protein
MCELAVYRQLPDDYIHAGKKLQTRTFVTNYMNADETGPTIEGELCCAEGLPWMSAAQ